MLRDFKFWTDPHLVAPINLQDALLRPNTHGTSLNPVFGTHNLGRNPSFRAPGTDFGSEKVFFASQEIPNQSIAQRGRGLTKCWCWRGCLSRPLPLDSETQSERTSLYEWAPGALQWGAGPAPDRGATSHFATI